KFRGPFSNPGSAFRHISPSQKRLAFRVWSFRPSGPEWLCAAIHLSIFAGAIVAVELTRWECCLPPASQRTGSLGGFNSLATALASAIHPSVGRLGTSHGTGQTRKIPR